MKDLTLNEYQKQAMTTCMESSNNPLYMLFMLGEEVGELHGKIAKAIRKEWIVFVGNKMVVNYDVVEESEFNKWLELVQKELGDILWGVAGLSFIMDCPLNNIGEGNLDKLSLRKAAGTIVGEGDGIIRGK